MPRGRPVGLGPTAACTCACAGNIYRAEILFKAGVHPEVRGVELSAEQFAAVWHHTVALMRRGFETGEMLRPAPRHRVASGSPSAPHASGCPV